jgi:membrane protein implicated in regulation of membrane protease activity
MDATFIADYAWVLWAALILVFIVVEVFTLDFTFLMLAIGSVGGLVTSLTDAPFWVQLIVTAVLAILLIFAVRPPLLRRLRTGEDPALSNIDALIGISAKVQRDFVDGAGSVKLANGETWTSRSTDARDFVEGDTVIVAAIEGATAVVAPVERIEP